MFVGLDLTDDPDPHECGSLTERQSRDVIALLGAEPRR
jgi:hypothetical protein